MYAYQQDTKYAYQQDTIYAYQHNTMFAYQNDTMYTYQNDTMCIYQEYIQYCEISLYCMIQYAHDTMSTNEHNELSLENI